LKKVRVRKLGKRRNRVYNIGSHHCGKLVDETHYYITTCIKFERNFTLVSVENSGRWYYELLWKVEKSYVGKCLLWKGKKILMRVTSGWKLCRKHERVIWKGKESERNEEKKIK
jgi:hypothetical protein